MRISSMCAFTSSGPARSWPITLISFWPLESLDKSAVLDGVFDFITYLRNNGIRTAVGSASKNTPVILGKTNLADKFDAVSCGLDTQKSKPDPEVFLIAAKKLGIAPSECVVIEDSDAGIEAAKAGGMYAIAMGVAENNSKADISVSSIGSLYKIITMFGR